MKTLGDSMCLRATLASGLLTFVVGITLMGATVAGAASPTELNTYLTKMHPQITAEARLLQQGTQDISGINFLNSSSMRTAAQRLSVTVASLENLVTALKAIQSPPDLRGTHATFVAGVSTEVRLFTNLGESLQGGKFPNMNSFDTAAAKLTAEESDWRQEIIAELRHDGVPVPFWVKSVGA